MGGVFRIGEGTLISRVLGLRGLKFGLEFGLEYKMSHTHKFLLTPQEITLKPV